MARQKRFELLPPEFARVRFVAMFGSPACQADHLTAGVSTFASNPRLATTQLFGASPLQMLPATLLQAHNKLHNMMASRPGKYLTYIPLFYPHRRRPAPLAGSMTRDRGAASKVIH